MAALDDQTKLAFASVTDLSKQLITLATGVVTVQSSFSKVFFAQAVDRHWQGPVSWTLLLFSLAAGVWVLMAVTGTLSKENGLTPLSTYGANIRIPASIQVLLFTVGLAIAIWFGAVAASEPTRSAVTPPDAPASAAK